MSSPGDAQALEEAKRHFQQGPALYNDQNYNGALAEFLAAYKARPSAAVLYNVGLTQKALFRYNDAIQSLERYLTDENTLPLERRNEVKQLISEMRALLADVTFEVQPSGAEIAVDGRAIGIAPLGSPYGLAAGSHVIDVTRDGFRPERKEVMVTAGVPLTVRAALQLIPKTGKLHVAVEQLGATVKVDSRQVGPSPVDIDLPLGGHTLEVWATGYETHREEVLIAPGQDRYVQVALKRPPPKVYQKAAFWAPLSVAIAAAVAGGVVGGILGSPRQEPLRGTLNPGAGRVD
jgi:hypothetical protein